MGVRRPIRTRSFFLYASCALAVALVGGRAYADDATPETKTEDDAKARTRAALRSAKRDDDDVGDTTYGRIDGDLGLDFAAGVAFGPRTPRLTGTFRLRYLDTIGLFGTYEESRLLDEDADPGHLFAFGLEVRPLFFARWTQGWETGRAYEDLAIDSIALELGGIVQKPYGASFGTRPGLQAGLGFELPLSGTANGAFVGFHGGGRWSDAALSGEPLAGPSDRSLYFAITIEWHAIVGAHLVDLSDRAPGE